MKDLTKALAPIDWRNYGPFVIGVDEVGRGCLAGPVYASAVLFFEDPKILELEKLVTDSKKLTAQRRDELSVMVQERCLWFVAQSSVNEIDELNILQASLLAMKRAIEGIMQQQHAPGQVHVVVDGNQKIPFLQTNLGQSTLIKGDLRCAPISAASIVAKVARDKFMTELAMKDARYGFDIHKGYGTVHHRDALKEHGPTEWHRRSFRGVHVYPSEGR